MIYRSNNTFISNLCTRALNSTAVKHPYLDAMREGSFPNVKMAYQDFAFQYGLYSIRFTQYLSEVINNLSNVEHKRVVQNNLSEERGNCYSVDLPPDVLSNIAGLSHARLYQRFQEALGIDASYRETTPQSQTALLWSGQFLQLCKTHENVGIGAVGIGTELIVSSIYNQIFDGLKAHSSVSQSQRVFFDLHSECDDLHAEQILSITEDLAHDHNAREQIEYGAVMALNMRTIFWDKMLERGLSFPASASSTSNAILPSNAIADAVLTID
jgi:pyrroloquinoline-quinone synthase